MPNAPRVDPFAIRDCALIAVATGSRAETLKDLRDNLLDCPAACLYYHFWGGLLHTRLEEREYNNDFAAWAWHALHDRVLGERLAMIDPTAFGTLEDLRRELIEVIEQRLDEHEYLLWAPRDQQFQFVQSQTVVFDTGRRADKPQDLLTIIPQFSAGSIFFHFIEARQRQPVGASDFQVWLERFGPDYAELREALGAIDPYFSSLTELRRKIAAVFEAFLGGS
jgi:Family of unknown function (DUF5752)